MENNELVKKVKQVLDERVDKTSDQLDQSLLSIRIKALDKVDSSSWNLQLFSRKSLATAFSVVALTVIGLSAYLQSSYDKNEWYEVTELEILTTEDNLEFYEDLEFYQWLLHEEMRSS